MAMQGLTGIFTAVALQFALPSGPPATQPVPHGPGVYTNREFGYRLHVPNGGTSRLTQAANRPLSSITVPKWLSGRASYKSTAQRFTWCHSRLSSLLPGR